MRRVRRPLKTALVVCLAAALALVAASQSAATANTGVSDTKALAPIAWSGPPVKNAVGDVVALPDGRAMAISVVKSFDGTSIVGTLESRFLSEGVWSAPTRIGQQLLQPEPWISVEASVDQDGRVLASFAFNSYDPPTTVKAATFQNGTWSLLPDLPGARRVAAQRWTSDGQPMLLVTTAREAQAYVVEGTSWKLLAETPADTYVRGAISPSGAFLLVDLDGSYGQGAVGFPYQVMTNGSWSERGIIRVPLDVASNVEVLLGPVEPIQVLISYTVLDQQYLKAFELSPSMTEVAAPNIDTWDGWLLLPTDQQTKVAFVSSSEDRGVHVSYKEGAGPWSPSQTLSWAGYPSSAYVGSPSRLLVASGGKVYLQQPDGLRLAVVNNRINDPDSDTRTFTFSSSGDEIVLWNSDYNEDSLRPLSVGSTRLVDPAPPGAVTSPVAQARKAGLTVRWKPPAQDGGSPIVGYEYRTSPRSAWVKTARLSVVITGLKAGKPVTVQIRPYNSVGYGPTTSVRGIPK
jgi:hypothetical protein